MNKLKRSRLMDAIAAGAGESLVPWVPPDLTNLMLLLDPMRITGLANGDSIAVTPDGSGYGRDATSEAENRKPIYIKDGLNGYPVIRFGADDGIHTPTINWGTGKLTMFAVFSAPAGFLGVLAEFSANVNTNDNSFVVWRNTDNTVYTRAKMGAQSSFETTRTITTTPKIFDCTIDTALATNEVTAWIDSITSGTRGLNNNLTSTFGNYALYIGARGETSLNLQLDLAMLAIYSDIKSDATHRAIRQSLAARFAKTLTKKVTVIGDSISAGATAEDWPEYFKVLYNSGDVILTNRAVAGARIFTGGTSDLITQANAAASDDADVIFIALGTNDLEANVTDSMRAKYEEGINLLKASNTRATIYGIGVYPCDPEDFRIEKSIYIGQACVNTGVEYRPSDGWFDPQTESIGDKLHPNAVGAEKIAIRTYQAM